MSDDQMFFLANVHKMVTYFMYFVIVVTVFLCLHYFKASKVNLFKGLAIYLTTVFSLWGINHFLLLNAPTEGITEIPYTVFISSFLTTISFSYLFVFCLPQPKKAKPFLMLLTLVNILYLVYDFIERGDKTIVEYISYSEIFCFFTALVMTICSTLYGLTSKNINTIKYLPLSLLFFCYSCVQMVYEVSFNFFVNQATKLNNIFLLFMSKIIFDVTFYVLLLLFVFQLKTALKNSKAYT